MYLLIAVFSLVFSVCVNGAVLKNDLFRLDIVHYNDFHARFEETTISFPVCKSNDTLCLGGFARLYYEIKTLLKEKPGALLLDAGDTFQGTYWYTLLKWNVTQKFINLLPNDAHTIGNHEFDDGVAGLAPYLAALQAPIVVANIDTSLEPSLNGLYKPHIILERKGRRIGIIGLTTTETRTSSNPDQVKFLDPIATVQREAQNLTDQGVDIILVLSHCGLPVDKEIASSVGENIDVIIGGHSHSLLWNGDSPSKEHVAGPYPVLVKSEANPDHEVLIVTAACFTKYLGNLTVYFDQMGNLKDFSGEPVFLNRSIPEDPEIKAILKPFSEKLHTFVNEKVGFAEDNLLAKPCGSQECAIGDFVADALLDAAKEMHVSNLTHVSFLLRNMMRGSIPKGDITRGDVINVLPFTNTVATFALQGKYLIDAFRNCMGNYWVAKPFQGPWMPQVAGLRLTLNLGDTVTIKVLVKEGEEFVALDPDQEYQVTTFNFIIKGGNGFDMLKNHGRNLTIVGKDSDIFERYVRKKSPIVPTLDNRLTVIN
ncbi:apyrase-like [Maniola jurtina]|uniref:apyrase-like n=1 Tax=Maniola jurtina TaxID=191418 RepID=UPI001E68A733|nr:apyrase-like [Maniola jurtina]